ncbi:cytochrome c biogenesis protein [Chitinophaga pinensis]|uniref:Cytochrome c-type biogenesis protein CcsB n=1 Tax=Chitinophaga pinensis (strain ATCC 43595 / DSM 2588 / LMG 13176 / NBRC 15968 / NCIMB 11800 / UQM 2034) TaxID=485918 RepID=A0A979G5W0_CHIPD|nr:cytochrome c biogenesis protein CcsA [Chitinophaga pinensis]ACU61243.1 cytochrome c-type biogenesis protein CcsB [Chitinophaga pinensis DSM 2588]
MLKKVFFSTRTMGVLLIVFAFAMAWATFIENDFGTPAAKELVYNSWWFEWVMILLVVNFLGNIVRYKLYRSNKWSLLVFHIAFLFMFLGGAVTRYLSFEGTMHIREGQLENKVISEATFFKTQISRGNQTQEYPFTKAAFLPANTPGVFSLFRRPFKATYDFYGEKVTMRMLDFIPRAQDSVMAAAGASMLLHLVTIEDGSRKNIYIPAGESRTLQGVDVGFEKAVPDGIAISMNSGRLSIQSALAARYRVMATGQTDSVSMVNWKDAFHLRALYNFSTGLLLVVPEMPRKGRIVYYEGDLKKNTADPDLTVMEIGVRDARDTVSFYGGRGFTGFQTSVVLKDMRIDMGYGSRYYYTPFYIHLDKFKLGKYPGSNAPSSFSSEVTVNDAGRLTPYDIYMNHTLDYGGFRFFQSSYDTDEKGTILSVNHDVTGTSLTYIGYVLLFAGMFFTLFWKGTRFHVLRQQLRSASSMKVLIVLAVGLLCGGAVYAQPVPGNVPDKVHAAAFGYLAVQNIDGRIEPVNTLALEILRKLYRHDSYYAFDANQFLLAVTTNPAEWLNVPLIKVNERGGKALLNRTQANAQGLTTIMHLLTVDTAGEAHFLLEQEYTNAFARRAADQDNYDKEVIELNDKMQVVQMLLSGTYLRILPIRGDSNNTWTSVSLVQAPQNKGEELVMTYFQAIQHARRHGNWNKADQVLEQLRILQRSAGAAVMPSQTKLDWEVRFNSWNLFFKLMLLYAVIGTILLCVSFAAMFKWSKVLRYVIRTLIALLVVAALLQTCGLVVRWYISGHAPWSNGYEAVMFISLIGLVSGLLLYRNGNSYIPAAGALIAVILMGFAHGGAQMNPQITPLVPVLKSYWLMIHVAIITASYGFLGLSALLGMFVLLLHIVNNPVRRYFIEKSLRELTIVNELSMIIGIFMLTCGTFLGGMWANESWGRYWSWDPKETWAFISVIVYAFVLHIRLIPGMQSKFLFNFLSVVSFSTVIMTYFGVNYYLSGLHSYAKGDPMPVPSWIYLSLATVAFVSLAALFRYRRLGRALGRMQENKSANISNKYLQ